MRNACTECRATQHWQNYIIVSIKVGESLEPFSGGFQISDNLLTVNEVRESIDTRVQWLGLVAAASGTFLTALDITVNVALPDIAGDFGTDAVTIQWIIIFYVGSSTAMQLGLGGAADVFGLKRMFMVGLIAYTVSVLAIGLSQDMGVVFGLRVVQSVGNGLLIALAPAIVTRLFPDDFRGRALGIMGGLGTLGMITGSLGGGFLVDEFGWRAIFLGRTPLCLAAIGFSAALLRVPGKPDRDSGFDLRGASTLSIALAALILLLSLGGRFGWTEGYIPVLAVVSVMGLLAFWAVERGAARPILELSLLRNRVLSTGLLLSLLAFVSTFVNWFILPFLVVDSLGASVSVWGALLMLMTVANALSAPAGGWLSDRANPAYTITASLVASLAAMLLLATLDGGSSATEVAVGLLAVGVGTGLFQSSNANLIMGSVPVDRLGTGGGMIGLFRGLGTVFSVAIMGAVLSARENAHRVSVDEEAAFELAYRETYLVAAAIVAVSVAVSLSLWPNLPRIGQRLRHGLK